MQMKFIPNLPDDEPFSKVRNDRRKYGLELFLETHPSCIIPISMQHVHAENATKTTTISTMCATTVLYIDSIHIIHTHFSNS